MTWYQLKKDVYYDDGSLRDIYVRETSREAWQRWAEFVNNNYRVEFLLGTTHFDTIDFALVLLSWNDAKFERPSLSIFLDEIVVKAYFFCEEEFENDIDPREIRSIGDHLRLIEYLKGVSKVFKKPVELTVETYAMRVKPLIVVNDSEVTIN